MGSKEFCSRFIKELNSNGFPPGERDRISALTKVFNMNRIEASMYLHGRKTPSEEQIREIADEFEVSVAWLKGESKSKARRKSEG
jgi:transcriptional regulator with XRE-family HTH domain